MYEVIKTTIIVYFVLGIIHSVIGIIAVSKDIKTIKFLAFVCQNILLIIMWPKLLFNVIRATMQSRKERAMAEGSKKRFEYIDDYYENQEFQSSDEYQAFQEDLAKMHEKQMKLLRRAYEKDMKKKKRA